MKILVNISEAQKFINEFDNDPKLKLHEDTLNMLVKQYPKNNKEEEVLVKVCCVNQFYSTQIKAIEKITKHILNVDFDNRIKQGDLSLVESIADRTQNILGRDSYVFASKYCSFHNPKAFAIYDKYVGKMLKHLKKQDKFYAFKANDLRNYEKYLEILKEFKDFYNLQKYSLKEIDKFLWKAGKHYFN